MCGAVEGVEGCDYREALIYSVCLYILCQKRKVIILMIVCTHTHSAEILRGSWQFIWLLYQPGSVEISSTRSTITLRQQQQQQCKTRMKPSVQDLCPSRLEFATQEPTIGPATEPAPTTSPVSVEPSAPASTPTALPASVEPSAPVSTPTGLPVAPVPPTTATPGPLLVDPSASPFDQPIAAPTAGTTQPAATPAPVTVRCSRDW